MISGVIRGVGHQLWGAAVTFTAYYVVGLPVGISLALATDLGVVGMWIGLLCGSVTHAAIYIVILLALNWQKESERAIKTASDTTKPATCENDLADSDRMTEESEIEVNSHHQQESSFVDDDDMVGVNHDQCHINSLDKIKLLISRGGVFIVGILLVISAGIASQYHPPESIINGNYSECTGNLTGYYN